MLGRQPGRPTCTTLQVWVTVPTTRLLEISTTPYSASETTAPRNLGARSFTFYPVKLLGPLDQTLPSTVAGPTSGTTRIFRFSPTRQTSSSNATPTSTL